jgi:AraC-like DNA-binding protein
VASFAGALVTGYGKVVQPEHPFVVVSSVPDAIAWLERPDAADVVEDMASLVNGDLLAAMRASLVHPFRIDRLDAMAAHLRVSARTLQRRLAQVGTSFQAELARARVKAAQGMLLSGDDKISAVAREVGFATQAHFTRVFRELTGLPPGEWRARERAARER